MKRKSGAFNPQNRVDQGEQRMKTILTVILASTAVSAAAPAFAHCTGYHPHHCSVSGVIGGIQHEGGHAAEMSKQFVGGAVNIWHDVYGTLPEWTRDFLNEYGAEVIGLYLGGIELGLAAAVTQDLLGVIETSAVHTKKAENKGRPAYITEAMQMVGADASLAVVNAGRTFGAGSKKYEAALKKIEELELEYLGKINNAGSKPEATDLANEFNNRATRVALGL